MLILTATPGTGHCSMLAAHSLAAADLTQGLLGVFCWLGAIGLTPRGKREKATRRH